MTGRNGTAYVNDMAVGSVTYWVYSYRDKLKRNGWIQAHIESDPFTHNTLLLNGAKQMELVLEDAQGSLHQGKFYVERLQVSGRNKVYGSLSGRGTLTEHTKNEQEQCN